MLFSTPLTVDLAAFRPLEIVDFTPLITLATDDLILLQTLVKVDLMLFTILEIVDLIALNTLLITDLIELITLVTVVLIAFQIFVTASLNPSLVFHNVIKATTSPAMSVTIRTLVFAFNAALKSHCAIVAPSFAVLYAVHAVVMALINDDIDIATFKVTNPAATPAISGDQSLNV